LIEFCLWLVCSDSGLRDLRSACSKAAAGNWVSTGGFVVAVPSKWAPGFDHKRVLGIVASKRPVIEPNSQYGHSNCNIDFGHVWLFCYVCGQSKCSFNFGISLFEA
jgi:hypothetical protein